MGKKTELAIVRHGETDWNVERRMQGHRDIPLNGVGLRQAARIAERLAREHWDACISSDLSRAAKTAELIARRAGIKDMKFDPRLRERRLGQLEGTTLQERLERWGEGWREMDLGAERDEALFDRAIQFLDETSARYEGKRVVVVTHGGWIWQLFSRLFPDKAGDHPANTSLSLIRRERGRWHCQFYNSTDHLKDG